jgi:hypothetical protein
MKMPRYLVRLTEVFYTEADSLEEAYSMWEDEADFVEIEEDEDDD